MRSRFHHLLEHQASADGSAPALTYKEETLDYRELWRRVRAFAAALTGVGLAREDRVAIFLEKRLETVVAIFGTSLATGVFVPINPLLRPKQVAYILDDCNVRVLVTSRDRLAFLGDAIGECRHLEEIVLIDADERPDAARVASGPRLRAWPSELADDAQAGHAEIGTTDFDMAAILYTSGSTGKPKGVVLSHRNLIVGAESVSTYLGNRAEDVILSVLPLSFDAGLSQITTAFAVGAHVVLMNYLMAGDVVRLCARHGVTGLTCVPPLWMQIVEQTWPSEASAKLRYFANTGGRMPRPTLDKLRLRFPSALPFLMYGLTEAFRSTYLDPGEVDRRPDSIGKAIPNAEILVIGPDGSECAPGEEGELVHRGPLVALGYWGDPARTAERFRPAPGRDQPWRTPEMAVFSGDVVRRDDEGFLYFVGRKDEMIKTSGYRVSPTEIEEVAYGTGLVGDAVALGIEDAKLGQRIVLVVSPPVDRPIEQEALLAEMKRQVPPYMVPARIVVRESLPRSPNGKFDRTLLRTEIVS